jgi:hypothetical protein
MQEDIGTLQSRSGTEEEWRSTLSTLSDWAVSSIPGLANYKYEGLLLTLESLCYHDISRDLGVYLLSFLILSLAVCLSLTYLIDLRIPRTMRFLSSLSVGVVLVGAVAGLVAPYTNVSTGLGDFPSLINVTTEDLATGLETGRFTSVDLVKAYSARIMEVNSTLHMVTELNPDALAIAAELDAMRANGTILGPLHGLPILIKNNIATADQMNNTGECQIP